MKTNHKYGYNSKKKLRAQLIEKHGEYCQYCGKVTPESEGQLDHIKERASGGSNAHENMRYCCRSCNSAKGDRGLEWLRKQRALQESPYGGIINLQAYEELETKGLISQPIGHHVFHFEKTA